jgi:hypothetical protein
MKDVTVLICSGADGLSIFLVYSSLVLVFKPRSVMFITHDDNVAHWKTITFNIRVILIISFSYTSKKNCTPVELVHPGPRS